MSTSAASPGPRRTGAETRLAVQRVCLELFTRQGYEATSLRQIADALGINKASLYYHFNSKEEIVRSLFQTRVDETEDLLAWTIEQPQSVELIEHAVLHWIDSFSTEKLRGIRLLAANPLLARTIGPQGADRIGANLTQFADILEGLLPHPSAINVVLLRMAILSINAAVQAAAGTGALEQQILAAARTAARALIADLMSEPAGPAPAR